MQVLISQSSFNNLKQSLFSPKEIIINLNGKYDRDIYYLTNTETLKIGQFDSVPDIFTNEIIFHTLKNSNFIGFFHTHPNNGSLGTSNLSAPDINFFGKIYQIWLSTIKKNFPLLLGVGSKHSNAIGVLYDIKFYILDEHFLPIELILHIIT